MVKQLRNAVAILSFYKLRPSARRLDKIATEGYLLPKLIDFGFKYNLNAGRINLMS